MFVAFLALCAVSPTGAANYNQQVIRYTEQLSDNIKIQRYERDLLSGLDETTTVPPDTTTKKIILASEDTTDYYSVKAINTGAEYWRELSESDPNVKRVSRLQNSHRLAVQVPLGFNFLFYGHSLKTVTIATGGFLYMSSFSHSFLTETQYVAPLMANFDTSLGNESQILYRDDDDAWIVQWSKVHLQGNSTDPDGPFTFQVQLWKNTGKIVFVYKEVPVSLLQIPEDDHPVKVGLSDAYYWDEGNYRAIFPYHTVKTNKALIQPGYAIIFTHLTTCNRLTDCDTCMNSTFANSSCYWCSKLEKCSDAFDRLRQSWVSSGCPHGIEQEYCSQMMPSSSLALQAGADREEDNGWKVAVAAICTFLGVTAAVILIALIYGYRNPQSSLGQFVIKNRPSELRQRFKAWKNKDDQGANSLSTLG